MCRGGVEKVLERLWIAGLAIGLTAADEAPPASSCLVDRAPSAIGEVFATPAGRPNWGADRLGDGTRVP